MTSLRPLAVALALLLVAACRGGEPAPSRAPSPSRSSATPTTTSPSASTATAPAPAPARDPREVSFTTSDGVTIHGTLHPAARVDAPAVVLVHQLSSTRAEWEPLVRRLSGEPSMTTLAIDVRGHGDSTLGPSGTLDWQRFEQPDWEATALDVRAAVAFLASERSGVTPPSIAAVGASIGCSAVVAAAVDEPRLRTIVTLSPGRAYHGFDAITPAMQLGDRAIFAVASRDETDSVATAEAYGRISHVPPRIVPGDAHGVVIFGTDPASLDAVEEFLRAQMAWLRLAPPPPSDEPPPVTSVGTPAPR